MLAFRAEHKVNVVVASSIVGRAKRRRAYFVFIDEAGFMLAPLVRSTWAPKGCPPIIFVAEPHHRISVVGAISISPIRERFAFYFRLSKDNANFHGPCIVEFLEEIRRHVRGPITLLWDEIAIHRSQPVMDYLHGHRTVVVEPFPAYAPELNPVDNVWAYVKHKRLANFIPPDLKTLRSAIVAEFRRLQKRPDLLRAFFDHTGLSLEPMEPQENGGAA